jgi:hypothetical protein
VPPLKWFNPKMIDVPLDMGEHAQWERIQDNTQRVCAQLASMKKTLSSGTEQTQGALVILGKEVLPLGWVHFFLWCFLSFSHLGS